MAFCKNCGNKLEDGAKFCPKCGTPSGSETKQDTETKQEKSSKKGGLITAIVVMAAIALGGAAWYFLGNQQDKYSLEGLAKAAVNYDAVGDFHDGLAMVTKGEKYGFIDKMGNEVVPCIYDFMEETDCSFHEGLAFVHQGDNYYFIDKEGKKAFDFKYDAANHFSEGLAIVWKDGKCGYIDKKGNEVIALTDKYFGHDFSEGLAAAMSKDGKLGFIDMKGNVVIPFNYDMTEGDTPLFSEGYAAVQKEGKYGFIDKNGKEVIPLKYDNAYPFSEGLAVVMLDEGGSQENKFGFVDKNGNMVIPCEYGSATSFSEGYAAVSKDEKYFFIDKNGKQAFPTSYDCWIGSFHDGIASVNKYEDKDFLVGYVDAKGNEIAPCIYSGNDFSEGLAVVQKDGLYGFIDKKGKTTFDIQNEEVRNVVQSKIQEKEEKRKQEEEEQRKAEDDGANEGSFAAEDVTSSSPNNNVDYSRIFNECQAEITLCQREIESLCRTFGTLASDNNIDMMKYGQMKITFINGVNEWLNKANKAFDKCSRDLQEAGVSNALSTVNQEKRQFNRAINELKSKTLQQAEMSY